MCIHIMLDAVKDSLKELTLDLGGCGKLETCAELIAVP